MPNLTWVLFIIGYNQAYSKCEKKQRSHLIILPSFNEREGGCVHGAVTYELRKRSLKDATKEMDLLSTQFYRT